MKCHEDSKEEFLLTDHRSVTKLAEIGECIVLRQKTRSSRPTTMKTRVSAQMIGSLSMTTMRWRPLPIDSGSRHLVCHWLYNTVHSTPSFVAQKAHQLLTSSADSGHGA